MTISRAQMVKELVPGLNALYGLSYAQYAEEHKEIYEEETSEKAYEEEVKLSGFGYAQLKYENANIATDSAQEAYTSRYVHETYALSFSITEEAMEDNLYESVTKRYVKALARSMAITKQIVAAAVLNNAFSSSYLGGDGVSLCSTSHPLVSGGVNSNRPSTGADLNETSLEAAVIQIANWTDERSLAIAIQPKKLIVPSNLMFVAERLLNTTGRVATADNDINAIRSLGAIPGGFAVNHYLSDNNAWFVTTNAPDGLKHFVRKKIDNKMEGDFDTGNLRYKARERFSFGWSEALGIYGSPGA